jgi:hypothetical protein
MKNANDINQLNKDSFSNKALTDKIDYETLSAYFAFHPHDVIQHTLRQTIQLAKSKIHYPMRFHLKSQYQMQRHKRLNKFIATDTYLQMKNPLKTIAVHKHFWECFLKFCMLLV